MATAGNAQATLRARVWIEEYQRQREQGVVDPLAVARAFKAMKRELSDDRPSTTARHH